MCVCVCMCVCVYACMCVCVLCLNMHIVDNGGCRFKHNIYLNSSIFLLLTECVETTSLTEM